MKKIYDKHNNPKYIPSSPVNHTKKWRAETAEYFRKKYGAWWYFVGVPQRKKKSWVEQFRKKGV
tara:strand:+ start:336 stop:527 length:192 start_codon:yes stop_codon:yes gene_type:complete